MLDYFKTILLKVSFDLYLFEKELRKAATMVVADELEELKQWCYGNFRHPYDLILNRVFHDSDGNHGATRHF